MIDKKDVTDLFPMQPGIGGYRVPLEGSTPHGQTA